MPWDGWPTFLRSLFSDCSPSFTEGFWGCVWPILRARWLKGAEGRYRASWFKGLSSTGSPLLCSDWPLQLLRFVHVPGVGDKVDFFFFPIDQELKKEELVGGRVKSGPRDCKAEISGGWSNDLFNGRNRVGRVIGRGTDSELYIKNWVFPCISSAKQGVVKKTEWMHERILEWEAVSWYQMPGSSSNPTFPEAFMFSSGFENEREERPLRWRKRMSKGTAKAMR